MNMSIDGPRSSTNEQQLVSSNSKDPQYWPALLSSGLTVFGVACAAAYSTRVNQNKDVGIAAWVAVAVIGSSAMIATAKHLQPRQSVRFGTGKQDIDEPVTSALDHSSPSSSTIAAPAITASGIAASDDMTQA